MKVTLYSKHRKNNAHKGFSTSYIKYTAVPLERGGTVFLQCGNFAK